MEDKSVGKHGLYHDLSRPCERVWTLPVEKWQLFKSSNLERDTTVFALIHFIHLDRNEEMGDYSLVISINSKDPTSPPIIKA